MKVEAVQLGFSPQFGRDSILSDRDHNPVESTPKAPKISPQCGRDSILSDKDHNPVELTPEAPKDSVTKLKQWTPEEDKLLVGGYLSVTKYGSSFWDRVASYYNEHRGQNVARNNSACERRWSKVNSAVSKFQEAYNQAEARKKGDESEADIFLAAHAMFESDMKKKFTLHQAWYMLRNNPKWKKCKFHSSSKVIKMNEQTSFMSSPCVDTPSSGTVGDETVIPSIDLKGAKRKGNSLAEPIFDSLEGIFEVSSKIADAEEKNSVIQKLAESQNRMARALEENTRAKKYKMLLKLEQRRTLSTREQAISEQLYIELFQD